VQLYIQQLLAEGAAPIAAEAPPAVDEGTELDVTPPAEASSAAP
jgi:hypothetical protein